MGSYRCILVLTNSQSCLNHSAILFMKIRVSEAIICSAVQLSKLILSRHLSLQISAIADRVFIRYSQFYLTKEFFAALLLVLKMTDLTLSISGTWVGNTLEMYETYSVLKNR